MVIEGKNRHRIYPGKNERVLKIVRKIMRGLTHFHHPIQTIADDRAHAILITAPLPPEVEAELHELFLVPNVAHVRAAFFEGEEYPDLHSFWAIKLMEVEFVGVIEAKRP